MKNGARRTGCNNVMRSCYACTDSILQLLDPIVSILLREATTCSCYDDACRRTDESMNEGRIAEIRCSSKLYSVDRCVINVHVYGILGTRELE